MQSTDLSTLTSSPSPGAKLALALSKAQGKFPVPKKTRKVDFTDKNGRRVKYNYADLADVIECLRLPLTENELSILHQLVYSEAGYGLKTVLAHSSGEFVDTWYPLPDPLKQQIRAQEFGSALTYARRYSLSSLVGIASEEDDDGQGAAPTEPPPKNSARKPVHNYAEFDPVEPKEFTEARRNREAAEREADRLLNLKNKGPSSPPQDIDQALASDPMPNYESGPEPVTLLDRLVQLAEQKSIPHAEMASIIRRVTGAPRKAKDLSQAELSKVVNFVEKFVSQKTE